MATIQVAYEHAGERGKEDWPAVWVKDGLAVTRARPDDGKGWRVTHVASGWAASRLLPNKAAAVQLAEALLTVGDWTRSRTAMQRDRTFWNAARRLSRSEYRGN
jgi:hypothetical protein